MAAVGENLLSSLLELLFRRRAPGLRMIRYGVSCLGLAFGTGWALELSFPLWDGQVDVAFDHVGGGGLVAVPYLSSVIGSCLIVAGIIVRIWHFRTEQRSLTCKRVIVIEARGLRDSSGTSLMNSLPSHVKGNSEQVFVDLRQGIVDGEVARPEAALEELMSLAADVTRREKGYGRSDLLLVYGGLTPVPLTFLTGVLMDDEGTILVLDWDRHAEAWRELDGEDDSERFLMTGVGQLVPVGTKEVAMAVSVSYGIVTDDLRARVSGMPVVELTLDHCNTDCHWSENKQRALGRQFLDVVSELNSRGVERIHLFLAAQNSLAYRFGRLYDRRTLPQLVVYQYQRGGTMRHPWGVVMPVGGVQRPRITS